MKLKLNNEDLEFSSSFWRYLFYARICNPKNSNNPIKFDINESLADKLQYYLDIRNLFRYHILEDLDRELRSITGYYGFEIIKRLGR